MGGITGCGAEPDRQTYAPPPAVASAQGWLLGLRSAGGTRLVARADVRDAAEWTVMQSDLRIGAVLVAYAYPFALADLGLTPGEVGVATGRSCRLEAPVAAFALDLSGAEAAWTPVDAALDDEVRETLFGGEACVSARRCDVFEMTEVPTSSTGISGIVAVDATTGLAADRRGRFWRLEDGAVTPWPELRGLPSRAVAPGPDDWWFGGQSGEVWRGPPEGPHEIFEVGTATQSVYAVLAAPPGAWAVLLDDGRSPNGDRTGELHVFDAAAGTWQRRHRHASDEHEPEKVDLLRLASGTVVVTYGGNDVFLVEDERVRPVFVGRGDFLTQVSAVLRAVDADRFVSGGRRGELVTVDARTADVDERRALLLPDTIYAVLPHGDGVEDGQLLAGAGGWVRQVWPDETPCAQAQRHPGEIWHALRVGRHVYLGGPRGGRPMNTLTVLSRP